jgi:hypothetical protein
MAFLAHRRRHVPPDSYRGRHQVGQAFQPDVNLERLTYKLRAPCEHVKTCRARRLPHHTAGVAAGAASSNAACNVRFEWTPWSTLTTRPF